MDGAAMMLDGAPPILQQVLMDGVAIRAIPTIMFQIKAVEFAKRRVTSQEIARKKANKKKVVSSVVKKAIIKRIAHKQMTVKKIEDASNVKVITWLKIVNYLIAAEVVVKKVTNRVNVPVQKRT